MSGNGRKHITDDADDFDWARRDLRYVQQTLDEAERTIEEMETYYYKRITQLSEMMYQDFGRVRQLLKILRSYRK